MSKTSTAKWMATAFEMLTTKYPEYCNRWISDDKWIDIIQTYYFTPPSKEKEEKLKFNRKNMVRAIGSQWQHTIDDFTPTNQNSIFRHSYMVSCNDEVGTKSIRRRASYFYATKPGRDYPTKPRVAEVFKDEEEMDNLINCLKKRKRAEDEVDQQIYVSTNGPLAADFDFSYWSSGDTKKLFVPLAGELASTCLTRDAFLTCCDTAILLKLHGCMVLIPMTRMACVNLQLY